MFYRFISVNRFVLVFCLFLGSSFINEGADNTPETETQVILSQIEAARSEGDWDQMDALIERISVLDPKQAVALRKQMMHQRTTRQQRLNAVLGIARIQGEHGTAQLLDIALNDPDSQVARLATMSLDNRTFPTALSESDFSRILSFIELQEDMPWVLQWVRIVAKTGKNDLTRLVAPVVNKYALAVLESERDVKRPKIKDIVISPEAYHLNNFLRVLPDLPSAKTIPLLKNELDKATRIESKRAFLLALGMSGDPDSAEDLQKLIESDQVDISIRALAIQSYERAVGARAIPFLEKYVSDETPGSNPTYPPLKLYSQSALGRIRNGW